MAVALNQFARYVRTEANGCPEIVIQNAILQAGIDFCKRTTVVKETFFLETEESVSSYDLTGLIEENTLPYEILSVKRDGIKLAPSNDYEFARDRLDTETGTPNYYYLDGKSIVLGLIPDSVESLRVILKTIPSESAATLPDMLADYYMREIGAGALSILMMQKDKPWTDYALAKEKRQVFDDAINSANLRKSSGASGKPRRNRAQFY